MYTEAETMKFLTREEHARITLGIEDCIPGEAVTLGTRHDSHETVDKEKRYKQILEIMAEHSIPLTAKEIAVCMCKKGFIPTTERNFSAPRLTEMSQKGMVEPVGKKKCKYTGKMVSVYILTNTECH